MFACRSALLLIIAVLAPAGVPLRVACGAGRPPGAAAEPVNIQFRIDSLGLPGGFKFERVVISCKGIVFEGDTLVCRRAELAIAQSPFGRLQTATAVRWSPATQDVEFETPPIAMLGGRVRVIIGGPGTRRTVKLELAEIRVPELAAAVVFLLPGLARHEFSSGRLAALLECSLAVPSETTCAMHGRVEDLSFTGVNVADGLDAEFELNVRRHAGATDFAGRIELDGGTVYVEPGFSMQGYRPGFMLEVADAIRLAGSATIGPEGDLELRHLSVIHPGIAAFALDGAVSLSPSPRFSRLTAALTSDDLQQLYTVYLQPLLLGSRMGSLEIAGGLDFEFGGADNELSFFGARFRDVHLEQDQRRFALFGLDGAIRLHDSASPIESAISWHGASLYRVNIGAGRVGFSSRERMLTTTQWQDLNVFDGQFKIDSLQIDHFGAPDMSITASGRLTPVSLPELTTALGWPVLAGRLSGVIPALTLEGDRLRLDGVLEVKVFDGTISVRDLHVADLFGLLPSVYANVDIEDLSLSELTSTFSFGNIEGRLRGKIRDLRLEAWQPVYFDASFETPVDDETPHRISRQAVDNLGRLGGGTGTIATQGLLSFIPSYSYGRLGIGCRLHRGYCEISGVEAGDDGSFHILTRGGLMPPWIDITGNGRRIEWRTLIDGLKQIAQGKWEIEFGAARD